MKTAAIIASFITLALSAPTAPIHPHLKRQNNLQPFTGALGGIAATPVTNSGDAKRPFQVKQDTFVNIGAALQRSCDQQFNACANAANGGDKSLSVSACSDQKTQCDAAGQGASNNQAAAGNANANGNANASAAAASATAAAATPCNGAQAKATSTAAAATPCNDAQAKATSTAAAAKAAAKTAAAAIPCNGAKAGAKAGTKDTAAPAKTTAAAAASATPCGGAKMRREVERAPIVRRYKVRE